MRTASIPALMQSGTIPNIPMQPQPIPMNPMQPPNIFSTPLKSGMIPSGQFIPQGIQTNPPFPPNFQASGLIPGNPFVSNMNTITQGGYLPNRIQGEFPSFPNIPGGRIVGPSQLISSDIISTSPGFERAASLCRMQGSQMSPNIPPSPLLYENPQMVNPQILSNSFINNPAMIQPQPQMGASLPPSVGFPSMFQMR